MTSKQRATLRSMAQSIRPIFHIGKGGINDNMINDIVTALDAHELIKIDVLRSCETPQRKSLTALQQQPAQKPSKQSVAKSSSTSVAPVTT